MVRFVNAKINIGLNICRRREDGYHDLESLFYPVGLFNGSPVNPEPFCDILEIVALENGETDQYVFTGRKVDCPPEKNLVVRAVQAFRSLLPDCGYFKITLDKHLPDGAGLGGGSADASFTLAMLNDLTGNPLTKENLLLLAAGLGADCPFFIDNTPAIVRGIGEIITPFPSILDGYWAVIVKPDIYVSTKEAFSNIIPCQPATCLEDLLSLPIEDWEAAGVKNDFEPIIFWLHPQMQEIKQRLYEGGAIYASMSGSGSSIYGIFETEESAKNCNDFILSTKTDSTSDTILTSYLCKL